MVKASTVKEGDASPGTATKEKKSRHRSPEHPATDLKDAIDKATVLYEKERFNFMAKEVALRHWGYTNPKSSSALRALAALSHYGLVDDEGEGANRKVKLSDLAKRILLDKREGSAERWKAIQEAALKPKLYADLWAEWNHNLPSDENMEHHLVFDKQFNPSSIAPFIKDFKATLDYAKLRNSDILPGDDGGEDDSDQDGGDRALPPVDPPPGREAKMPGIQREGARAWDLTIPLVSGGQATLRAPIPMTEEDYTLLTSMLESTLKSMKKAITRPQEREGAEG